MSALIDQAERDRFVVEQGKNISVIAPAGVGKTTSIVARIVHLARLPEAEAVDRLSRLIVVTYSVRAAQQMQQKARVAIRAVHVQPVLNSTWSEVMTQIASLRLLVPVFGSAVVAETVSCQVFGLGIEPSEKLTDRTPGRLEMRSNSCLW